MLQTKILQKRRLVLKEKAVKVDGKEKLISDDK